MKKLWLLLAVIALSLFSQSETVSKDDLFYLKTSSGDKIAFALTQINLYAPAQKVIIFSSSYDWTLDENDWQRLVAFAKERGIIIPTVAEMK